ncbi:MAG TPA: 4-(cytidine 5'-diphospho)-2-C-methyl-D-erythritol kinase, partial [Mobilitalea sp.]|nr:4-(cytidine 5'-diphospho)-2-C-methyl-D-erythritol kinase [Mobilitalea sp.]
MNSITMKAYAKINLGLDVLRKREDGYHDVCMIMQTIDLYDTLTIKITEADNIGVSTNLSFLPDDQRNLAYKAAALFSETLHKKEGLKITLEKKIPVAAGLAGGSADAAATLIGLNKLFGAELSQTELMKLGVKLGADVPYCVMKGTALSEGIGEVLTPIKPIPDCNILLVKPNISVSTKYVYENLRLDSQVAHPDIPSMLKAIDEGNLSGLTEKMDNILQTVTVKDYPVINRIKRKMIDLGAMTSLMSGSGPTVFGIYSDR